MHEYTKPVYYSYTLNFFHANLPDGLHTEGMQSGAQSTLRKNLISVYPFNLRYPRSINYSRKERKLLP